MSVTGTRIETTTHAPGAATAPPRRIGWTRLTPFALLSPAILLYASLYLGGLVMIALTSVGISAYDGGSPTMAHYQEIFASERIATIVARTLRVSVITVVICMVIGFPVARYITSPEARWRALVIMAVLSPLMVSAIGRIFGWIALFGPGSWVAGLTMHFFGTRPTGLLYTEVGMVIGLVNILLPFMVLSIAASRAHLDPSLLKAASSLGATPFAAFRQVELPLSLPGLVSGVLICFSLAISNFVTAALLGGSGRNVIAYEIYVNMLTYFQPGRGAALSMLLLVTSVVIMVFAVRAGRSASEIRGTRS